MEMNIPIIGKVLSKINEKNNDEEENVDENNKLKNKPVDSFLERSIYRRLLMRMEKARTINVKNKIYINAEDVVKILELLEEDTKQMFSNRENMIVKKLEVEIKRDEDKNKIIIGKLLLKECNQYRKKLIGEVRSDIEVSDENE